MIIPVLVVYVSFKCAIKCKTHYPFKWIQLIERSNYLIMNSRLH